MGALLESIHSPADLKRLSFAQMAELADEIRAFLIQTLSKTGGHLGPNLGVVELTLALHSVFNTPEDKLLFDVSHQAYIHKILTGRLDRFATLRSRTRRHRAFRGFGDGRRTRSGRRHRERDCRGRRRCVYQWNFV
jgi:deoxyxylulose-5-phosphate synthase